MENLRKVETFKIAELNYPALAQAMKAGGETVFTLNLAHIRMLSQDEDFRRSYGAASLVTLDSQFLNLYFLGGRHNVVTGSDFVRYAAESGVLAGSSVLIVGNLERERAASLLPSSRVDVLKPSFGFYNRPEEMRTLVDAIVAADPDVVFIAVGAPQSERLARQLREAGLRGSVICCGAAFEFLVGKQARAPTILSKVGLEWIWRVGTNPRRLAARYWRDASFVARHAGRFVRLGRSRVLDFDGFSIRFPGSDRASV